MANEARADEVMKSLQKTFGTKKNKKEDKGDGLISGKMDDGKLKSFLKGIGLKDGGPTNIDGLARTGRTRAGRS